MSQLNTMHSDSEYIFSALQRQVVLVEKSSRQKVLNFSIGEPDVIPCQEYVDEYSRLVKDVKLYRYPGYGTSKDLSNAIIQWYRTRFKSTVDHNEILPLNGAKDGITHLPFAILNKGDEILIPNPGYPAFTKPVILAGAVPVYYDILSKNNYKLDYMEILSKLSSKTKFMWVNFPSNPTGQVASQDDLKKLVTFARKHNIFIIYDNAYSDITFNGFIAPSILSIEGAKDLAIEIGSFSKSYSFAGLRMGWAVGNTKIINALKNIKTQFDSGMPLPLQLLGAYVLNNPNEAWIKIMISSYENRRKIIANYLESLGLKVKLTQGSLYIWAELPEHAEDSDIYCRKLLNTKHVLLTPGTAFGSNGKRFVRVSIGVNVDSIEDYT
jgi:LL-diaminopimelate aminotransferase